MDVPQHRGAESVLPTDLPGGHQLRGLVAGLSERPDRLQLPRVDDEVDAGLGEELLQLLVETLFLRVGDEARVVEDVLALEPLGEGRRLSGGRGQRQEQHPDDPDQGREGPTQSGPVAGRQVVHRIRAAVVGGAGAAEVAACGRWAVSRDEPDESTRSPRMRRTSSAASS